MLRMGSCHAARVAMKMRLFCSLSSPYSRKVRVVADELGLSDLIEEVITDPYNPPPDFLAANPLSKIPTLITDKGEALPDSDLIIEYLNTRGRGLAALPRGSKRWSALRRLQVANGIIDAAVATVIEKRKPESIVHIGFLDRQSAAIQRAVELLALEVQSLSLEAPTVVELVTAIALSYVDLRLPYLHWPDKHTALAGWLAAMAQRPSMIKTQPPPG